jgi:hypothetical protein
MHSLAAHPLSIPIKRLPFVCKPVRTDGTPLHIAASWQRRHSGFSRIQPRMHHTRQRMHYKSPYSGSAQPPCTNNLFR